MEERLSGDATDRGRVPTPLLPLLSSLSSPFLSYTFLPLLYESHTIQSLHLTRGNHESQSMNKLYGFNGEVKHKYGPTMVEVFRETFCWLPLAYVLEKKVGNLPLHFVRICEGYVIKRRGKKERWPSYGRSVPGDLLLAAAGLRAREKGEGFVLIQAFVYREK
jgi:hypothetical protein